MRKILVFVAAIMMIVVTMGIASAGGVDILSVGGSTTGTSGQDIDITIDVTNMKDIGELQLDIVYNKNTITASSAISGNIASTSFANPIIDNGAGIVSLHWSSALGMYGTGTLATITFHVIGNPGDTSNLDIPLQSVKIFGPMNVPATLSLITSGAFRVSLPTKKDQTITFGPLSDKTYGDAPFGVSATASSGLPVSFSIVSGPATISGSTVTIFGAGAVIVRSSQVGDNTYNAAPDVDQTFTVISTAKKGQTIKFNTLSNVIIGGPPFDVFATTSSGLPASFSIVSGPATISGNTVTYTGVGTVTIRASQAGDNTYYPAADVDQIFVVAKKDQTINFDHLNDRTTGDLPFNLFATSSSGLPVNFNIVSGPATISGSTVTTNGVGKVTIRASQTGDNTYNAAPDVDQTFAVSNTAKKDQTIIFGPLTDKTSGDAPFTVSATASSGLPVNFNIASGPATISGSTVTITGVGTVTVRASQIGDNTYNAAPYVDQTFTVGGTTKKTQTITFGTLSNKINGDAPFNIVATASSGLPITYSIVSGPATISGSTVTITGVGTVTVRASQAGDNTYGPANDVDQTFTVGSTSKQNQIITFGPLTDKTNGDVPFNIVATASSGLPVSFSIASGPAKISGSTVTITGVGTVTVRASQVGDNTYKAAPDVDKSFIVKDPTKKGQTITFGPLTDKTNGDAPFNIVATASSGLPVKFNIASGPATILGNTVTITGVGTVKVRASQIGDNTYGPANDVDQTFTVTNIQKADKAVQGKVFHDLNGDKKFEKGEPGIKNVVIRLTGNDRNTKKIKLKTKTNNNGNYKFSNLPNGKYKIRAYTKHGWSYTVKNIIKKNGKVVIVDFPRRPDRRHNDNDKKND